MADNMTGFMSIYVKAQPPRPTLTRLSQHYVTYLTGSVYSLASNVDAKLTGNSKYMYYWLYKYNSIIYLYIYNNTE